VRRRFSLAALTFVLLLWNAALFAAPTGNAPRVSGLTYVAGALVCHQQPERSFHRAGAQYPVCARCLGLYTGATLGVAWWIVVAGLQTAPHTRATRCLRTNVVQSALVIAAIPTLLTVALAWMGLWDASNTIRAGLAFPLGAAIAAVIAAVAAGDLR
jgi:uncharacterized membrane protein